MIVAEQRHQGRVEVVGADLVDGGLVADRVGLAVSETLLHPAAGHPQRVGARAVVAADVPHLDAAAVLAHRGAAEFAAPDDQRFIEQPALLEVVEQGGDRLVDLIALVDEALPKVGLRIGAVGVPAPVEELDEAHAALGEAAGEQAVVGEGFLTGGGAVFLVHRCRLLFQIEGIRRVDLHAEGHFILRDAGDGLRVADLGGDALVEVVQRVERPAAQRLRDAVGIREIKHRLALRAALHALIDAGQVAGAPDRFAGIGVLAAGGQHDEAGQVRILRAEAVGRPRTGRRRPGDRAAGVHEELRGAVVELVGPHRFDEADLVDDFLEMGQPVGDPLAALAGLVEGELRAEHLRHALDEGELLAFEVFLRALLAVELGEFRLVVEELELARRAGHVQVDHALCLRSEVGEIGHQRIRWILLQDGAVALRSEPQPAEADRAVLQEMPTRLVAGAIEVELLEEVHSISSLAAGGAAGMEARNALAAVTSASPTSERIRSNSSSWATIRLVQRESIWSTGSPLLAAKRFNSA